MDGETHVILVGIADAYPSDGYESRPCFMILDTGRSYQWLTERQDSPIELVKHWLMDSEPSVPHVPCE